MRSSVLLAVLALAGVAAAQTPMIRAHLEPAENITVGEPVRLVITVLVPNYFTGSPEFPEFEIENAIVVLPQETPQNSSERVQGVTYAAITETYTLYPQQAGDFSLPSAQIDASYASTPPKRALAHLTLPLLTFRAEIPAAARGLEYFLPTTKLTIEQRWTPAPKALRVGDTIERTITVTAAKLQAMLIPPLQFKAADGIRIYEEEPKVHDEKSNRNEFLFGQRTQSAQYLMQKEGSYTLPAIELKWWNVSTRKVVKAVLPAVHFEVAENPAAATELAPEQPQPTMAQQPKVNLWARYKRQIWVGVLWLLGALLLLWLAWQWLPRLYRSVQHWRTQRRELEQTYFRAVVKACNENHPKEAYAALLLWLNRRSPGKSLDEIYASSQDADLMSEINRLGAILFTSTSGDAQWDGRRLADLLRVWRKQEAKTHDEKTALVALNP
ncbi:BatD family protein [Terracidiphilus gabretensis]|uniref:BatD family protein n=1 Tax=Terracidiphilus gabretensis TaxID=1577687 RepID=UPI00071BC540|nr:BatD family protein [Terracidiphilus gabretensis]